MKYLVDVVVTVKVKGVMITVDEFDKAKMAELAADKFSGAIRYDNIQDVIFEEATLDNWERQDY